MAVGAVAALSADEVDDAVAPAQAVDVDIDATAAVLVVVVVACLLAAAALALLANPSDGCSRWPRRGSTCHRSRCTCCSHHHLRL